MAAKKIYSVEETTGFGSVISREYFATQRAAKNWARNLDKYIISELVERGGRYVFNEVIGKVYEEL